MPYRLIYASAAASLAKQDIEDILNVSERHNPRHGITGALIFNTRIFMQLLEGAKLEVESVYAKIGSDRRHSGVTTIAAHDADDRLFGDWSMRYLGERQTPPDLITALSPNAAFRPHEVTEDASIRLMRHLAAA